MEDEDEESVNSGDDNLSDGYLSDSGSDVSEDGDATKRMTSDITQPYLPPQLQPQTSNPKLRKSINGLINRYCTCTEMDCGFKFPY